MHRRGGEPLAVVPEMNAINTGKANYNRLGAFILADIYRFTYINDVYGFDIDDELLKLWAGG